MTVTEVFRSTADTFPAVGEAVPDLATRAQTAGFTDGDVLPSRDAKAGFLSNYCPCAASSDPAFPFGGVSRCLQARCHWCSRVIVLSGGSQAGSPPKPFGTISAGHPLRVNCQLFAHGTLRFLQGVHTFNCFAALVSLPFAPDAHPEHDPHPFRDWQTMPKLAARASRG